MLQVNVARLHDDNREALSLAWIAGREGGTTVRAEAGAGRSLIGHLNLTHPNSIQVIGAYEAGMIGGFRRAPARVASRGGDRRRRRLAAASRWSSRRRAPRRRSSPRRCPRRR
jgi:hypothetical protein